MIPIYSLQRYRTRAMFSLVAICFFLSCIIVPGQGQAMKDKKYLWKGGIIPYEISSGYSKSITDKIII